MITIVDDRTDVWEVIVTHQTIRLRVSGRGLIITTAGDPMLSFRIDVKPRHHQGALDYITNCLMGKRPMIYLSALKLMNDKGTKS